ncbi:MAG: hypothetical protein KDB88_03755 [Flavobacteriales bacterium]|nr:hypothetical protein [Flavobacteriales bacterium]
MAHGQSEGGGTPLSIHGNFSSDVQYYNEDSAIGAVVPPERLAFNAWGNVLINYGKFSAGLRIESYDPSLVGYPAGQPYDGTGLGYRFVSFKESGLEVTVGNFFEQFGQGLTYRTYEERYLGVDNAMDGVRIKYAPVPGLYLKGVIGEQRFGFQSGFTKGPGVVRGADAEISLGELLPGCMSSWSEKGRNVILGGSFVSKYQADDNPSFELPENVGVWGGRLNYQTPKWNIYGEYAYKINDPNAQNRVLTSEGARPNYRPGEAILLNATYSVRGLGISAGYHRFDNMFFQSDRNAPSPFDLNINFLPPLAKQHTYNLPATLYPYATQPNSEVSWQGEVFYKFKKGSPLGGKYGTKVTLNFCQAYGLDTTMRLSDDFRDYTVNSFGPGEKKYFTDMNVEVRKKLNKNWEVAASLLYLEYDLELIQGKPGAAFVYATMGIVDVLHKFSDRNSVRFEAQHLWTEQDQGRWATVLAEFTFSPHWFVALMDQYNYVTTESTFIDREGREVETERIQYPIGQVGYINGGNRFTLGYGRQRAGIFCVGGVCRAVPASNGLTLSITSTF